MPRNKLYQCPYSNPTKCDHADPCLGCEEFAAYIKETGKTVWAKRPAQLRKAEIELLLKGAISRIDEHNVESARRCITDALARLSAIANRWLQ